MQIHSRKYTMHLEDDPLDIGYASESVKLLDASGKEQTIGGHTGKTQLFISLPFIDTSIEDELRNIDDAIPDFAQSALEVKLIVANDLHTQPKLDNIEYLIDTNGEYADWYGVRLLGEPYDKELTKAAILVSKDGAIFYDEFIKELSEPFNTETLYRKILAAQQCYTGKGCH